MYKILQKNFSPNVIIRSAVFRQPQTDSIREITREVRSPTDRSACQDKELMEDGNELSMSRVVCFVLGIPARCFGQKTNERGREATAVSTLRSCLIFFVGAGKTALNQSPQIEPFAKGRRKTRTIGDS